MIYTPLTLPDTWADRMADAYWANPRAFTGKIMRTVALVACVGILLTANLM